MKSLISGALKRTKLRVDLHVRLRHNMKIKNKLAVIFVSTFLLVACTTNKVTPAKFSGFLDDYSILRPAKKDKDILVYLRPDVNWHQYDRLQIDTVQILTPENISVTASKQELLTEVADMFREKLISHLSKEFTIVNDDGPHTLRLQTAITSIYESFNDLRGYQFIPVAAIITAAMRTSGVTKKKARMMSEGRLVDASTGTLLAEAIDLKEGKIIQKKGEPVTLSDLEPVLEVWAKRIAQKLLQLKNDKLIYDL